MTRPLASRSPRSPLFGKRDVTKTAKVSFDTSQRLAQKVHALGMTESEFIATLIEGAVYGVHELERLQKDRLHAVFAKGLE